MIYVSCSVMCGDEGSMCCGARIKGNVLADCGSNYKKNLVTHFQISWPFPRRNSWILLQRFVSVQAAKILGLVPIFRTHS